MDQAPRVRATPPEITSQPVVPVLSLDLAYQDSVWIFDFIEGRDAVVVGSDPGADVFIDARGVAPLHFHFERAGDQIALVSGYGKDVRLNAMLVRGVHSLVDLCVLEFGGVSVGVRVRRIGRCVHLYSSPPDVTRTEPRGLAGETQGDTMAIFARPTAVIELSPHFDREAETAERPAPFRRTTMGSFGDDFRTEEMVMCFDWELPEPAPAPVHDSRGALVADWLEGLGLLARARPVAVTATALITAVVVAFALIGVRSVFAPVASEPDSRGSPRGQRTTDGMSNMRNNEMEERQKREPQREAAEALRAALVEYVQACEAKRPELLAAIEVLGMDIERLGG